jgi:hypothetical protein
MGQISKQLGFSVGSGHRTLSLIEKKKPNIAKGMMDGWMDGWIMLTKDEQQFQIHQRINLCIRILDQKQWHGSSQSVQGQSCHQTRSERIHYQRPYHRCPSLITEDGAHVQFKGTA